MSLFSHKCPVCQAKLVAKQLNKPPFTKHLTPRAAGVCPTCQTALAWKDDRKKAPFFWAMAVCGSGLGAAIGSGGRIGLLHLPIFLIIGLLAGLFLAKNILVKQDMS